MSKNRKIIIIASVAIVAVVIAGLAVFAVCLDYIYVNISAEDPPAQVADFEDKADDTIRIMSFNIRCTNLGPIPKIARHSLVEETIINSEADSFGVQEATPSWMNYLSDALEDKYGYVGVGRNNGKNSGEYSAIFYLKDKYELIDSGTFWLSETPDEPSKGWDASFKRICTWAVLENKATGERYAHFNAHFDHKGVEARKNSVDLILSKISEYGDIPVVFTADMNIEEGTEAYTRMLADGTLTDAKYTAEETMDYLTFHNLTPSENETKILDYVMINDEFDAEVYKVVTAGFDGKYVSDHFPVYADLNLK
ncbi:MAG: endonuclease/exonuclease/phosphatase family protein [Clostridia bacterium]|nr:endonuclease/exonuclease/phosphatase family protein [Clostridia bacterium]